MLHISGSSKINASRVFVLLRKMCCWPNNLMNNLTGEVSRYSLNMIIAVDFRANSYFCYALTCPCRYLPKKIPSSTYLPVSETHMGNCPVARAVCPFSIPV